MFHLENLYTYYFLSLYIKKPKPDLQVTQLSAKLSCSWFLLQKNPNTAFHLYKNLRIHNKVIFIFFLLSYRDQFDYIIMYY